VRLCHLFLDRSNEAFRGPRTNLEPPSVSRTPPRKDAVNRHAGQPDTVLGLGRRLMLRAQVPRYGLDCGSEVSQGALISVGVG
jgi:hypothetical protein